MQLNLESLTQLAFSIGVSWYLLFVFQKRLEAITKEMQNLATMIQMTQTQKLNETKEVQDMFTEIKELIKETSNLVRTTSESVNIQNELTKHTLNRLDPPIIASMAKP